MGKIDRMMQLFEYNSQGEGEPVPNGCMHYTHTTLAHEQQVADDLARHKGLRQGEGHITVYDLETDEVLKKLQLPI